MKKSLIFVGLTLASAIVTADASAATATKSCTIFASGDACLFEVTPNSSGSLGASTEACTAGDRWRTSIVKLNAAGAISSVGTGSKTTFTGLATRSVVSSTTYIILITFERPLAGEFPRQVDVKFTGPFATVSGPRSNDTSGLPPPPPCIRVPPPPPPPA